MNWISIKDKLPEEETHVLCIQADGYICQGYYDTGILNNYNGFSDDGITETVVYWVPLSELALPEE